MSDSENGKGDNETTQPDVKEEDNEDQKDSADSKQEEKSTNEEKKPKKTVKKEEVKEDDDEDEDEGSEESEEEVGLLDRPVEVSGSRERKKVERLEVNFRTHTNKAEIPEGRGEKLGDCPRIEFKIQKTPVEELKALHKLLFNRPGSAHEIKKNIRKFSGFSFVEGTAEFEKKKSALEKQKIGVLKQMCEVLDIERSGVREDLVSRIVQFLLEPKSSGKQVPVAKSRKRSSTKGGRPKHTEKEKKTKKGSAKKRKKASDSEEEGSDESVEKDEEEEEDEEDVAAEESDESFEEPKKKKKSKPRKKKETTVKEKKKEKNGEKSKKAEDKKTPAKAAKRKSGSSDDSDDESSDGEPLAKKVKSPPSDDEIKQLVKKILDDADLEEITMKKVIKQVFDAYPDFDLSEKKDYIKATVKSVIS